MNTLVKDNLLADLNVPHERDVPLGPLTWYGVGGNAAILAHPTSLQTLAALAARCHDTGVPVYVLGKGANLLVGDAGVDGVVVQLDDPCFKRVEVDGCTMTVGAGCDLAKLVLQTAKLGLGGLECLAGIPATIGGALRMNAGGVFGEIGPIVNRVMTCDARGQNYYRERDDLVFGYRCSNITARYILEAELTLTPDDPEQLMRRVKEIFLYKKTSQPLADASAGCAFKNPRPPADQPASEAWQTPSAGKLIDDARLKGFQIGGAQVSRHHANFVVTHPGCTAGDVVRLLDHIQRTVSERFGVLLQREVVCWP